MNILNLMFQGYKKIGYLCLLDCDLTLEFFKRNIFQIITRLYFHGCQLGNSAADKLSCQLYKHIQYLRISSDSIGNKGIEKLTKLHMPNLTIITISNTNITTDSIKVMKKIVMAVGEGLTDLAI